MKTRCKFKCVENRACGSETDPAYQATFEVVQNGSPENMEFFRWTPSGRLTFAANRGKLFEEGKEYYVDIIPCDEVQPV